MVPISNISTYCNKDGDVVGAIVSLQLLDGEQFFDIRVNLAGEDFEVENLNNITFEQMRSFGRAKAIAILSAKE